MPTKMKDGRKFTAMVFGYKGKDGHEPLRCVVCDQELKAGDTLVLHVADVGHRSEVSLDFKHSDC